MEGAALNTPPERLDRAVRLLIPPAAREVVVGDLWETYQSPSQYAREALCIVPFVVFSQMRRHFNLPALILQAMVLYACLGAWAAALLLPVLTVAQAYQPLARPTPRRAMREATLLAFALVIFLQGVWSSSHGHSPMTVNGVWLGIGLFFIGPCLVPFLCLLRTSLIVGSDRRPTLARSDWTAKELAQNHAHYAARLRRPTAGSGAAGRDGVFVLVPDGRQPAGPDAGAVLWRRRAVSDAEHASRKPGRRFPVVAGKLSTRPDAPSAIAAFPVVAVVRPRTADAT